MTRARRFVVVLSILSLTFAAPLATPVNATTLPTWAITVNVKMAQSTVDDQGGLVYALSRVSTQFDTINHRFNDTGRFKGIVNFRETSFAVYSDMASNEKDQPHPDSQLQLIYDENQDTGGGWFGGASQTIVHDWDVADGGLFGPNATDGLVHEFGHSREATDEYALNVDATKNPIDGKAYQEPYSIMVYPYGVRTWSDYSVGLINQAADKVNPAGPALASGDFPAQLQVKVVNSDGRPLSKAKIALYPVAWFTYSVAPTPTVSGSTNGAGLYKLSTNPFQPGSKGSPWDMKYCNFRVKVTSGAKTGYAWMPLTQVGAKYFSNPNSTYTLTVRTG